MVAYSWKIVRLLIKPGGGRGSHSGFLFVRQIPFLLFNAGRDPYKNPSLQQTLSEFPEFFHTQLIEQGAVDVPPLIKFCLPPYIRSGWQLNQC